MSDTCTMPLGKFKIVQNLRKCGAPDIESVWPDIGQKYIDIRHSSKKKSIRGLVHECI